jgi:uncharacterized protein YcnI
LSLKRILCVLFLGSFILASPASAHVSVSSDETEPGAEVAVLTFHVPTESATASTTKLAVQLPVATPFSTVSVLPMQGWSFTTKTTALAKPITTDDGDQISKAVTEVDWTASADGAIKPGEFGNFSLRVGPLPDADSVSFGALQTYSDGSTVAWNQVAAPGSDAEPEHPKPTLTLTAATATPKPASTTSATVLSIVALVVAALALGIAVVGNARRKAT